MERLSGCGALAAVCVWLTGMQPFTAQADDVVWQAPVLADVASATSVGNEVVSSTGTSAGTIIVTASFADAADWVPERSRSRFMAFDVASGERVWQRELDADCSRPQFMPIVSIRNAVALFPNGDVAVAAFAKNAASDPQAAAFVCYARLDGGDGHILWTRKDIPDASGTQPVSLMSIAVDANGDLVLIGRRDATLRAAKFSGADGSSMWTHEESLSGRALNGAAVDIGPDGAIAVLANLQGSGVDVEHRALSLAGADGALRWTRALCASGADVSNRSWHALADGSIAYVDVCASTLTVGRLAGADGTPIWQNDVGGTAADYQIDAAGDAVLAGALNVGGVATAMARYAAADGHLVFSTAGVLGGPEPGVPNVSSVVKLAVGDGSVHVWELLGDIYSQGISPGRVSRYDAVTGQLLGRVDLAEPAYDYLFRYGQQMKALPGGDVWMADLSTHAGGGWFWHGRMQASAQLAWNANERVVAGQPLLSERDAHAGHATLVASNAGVPGIVVGGRANIDVDTARYLYLAKLAQDDGRELWSWQPQPFVPDAAARLDGLIADASGALFVAGVGTNLSWNGAPFLAKLDGATGQPLWLRFDETASPDLSAHDLALDRVGNPYVLSAVRLSRHASGDGAMVWSVDLPDGSDSTDSVRLAVDAHGDAVFSEPYESSTEHGLQVGKVRGSDGAIVWLRRFPASFFVFDAGRLAMLTSGDVVVTAPLDDDLPWLARLSSTDGSVVWQRRDITPSDMLIDRAGQVVIEWSSNDQAQLYRLDAASGDTLWTVAYVGAGDGANAGPAGEYEGGKITDIALTGNGDLLVTGNIASGYGIAAVSLTNGSQRWFASAAVSSGYPVAVVEGSAGRVFVAGDVSTADYYATATVFDVAGAFNESIFASGFD